MAEPQTAKRNQRPPAGGGPGGGPARHGFQKPKNTKNTLLRLIKYLGSYKYLLILVFVMVFLQSASSVLATYLLAPIIDDNILPLIGQSVVFSDFLPLIRSLIILSVIYVFGAAANYGSSRIMLKISQGTLNIIRKNLFSHMQTLPLKYFDTHTHGELMSRYTSDVDTLREFIGQSLIQLISSVVSLVSTFVMMLVISPPLTLLIVVMLAVMLLVTKKIGSKSATFFRKQQKAAGAVNGYIEEMVEGQRVVKVFCHEEESKAKFSKINSELRDAATNANTYASIIMPIMGNLSYFNYAATATIGAALMVSGSISLTIGGLTSFLQYTRQFSQPITQVSQQFNVMLAALAGAERIFEVLDTEPEIDDGYVTLVNAKKDADGNIAESSERTGAWAWKHPHGDASLTYTEWKGDVRFENVTFSYDGENDVLKNISLYARPGEKIAFVGSTGAGKTTITNLINRFYDVQQGKITYDGINVKKIKKDDLRRSLAMVLQDTHLFTGSVEENIAYGRLDATHEEIVEAAKLANAHSFISRLPNGYDTMITGDGANLSQGQRQLLAIARAAVANPPVLILDEATSSVDTRTEALIEKGMDKLMEGRTVFVIAHRLSTVRNSNAIMVLEHGEIIERGNHEDLIESAGRYYQLYTGQFELE